MQQRVTKTDIVAAKRAVLVLREAIATLKNEDAQRQCRLDMSALCRVINYAEGITPIEIIGS